MLRCYFDAKNHQIRLLNNWGFSVCPTYFQRSWLCCILSGENLFDEDKENDDNQRRVIVNGDDGANVANDVVCYRRNHQQVQQLQQILPTQLRDALKSIGPFKLVTPGRNQIMAVSQCSLPL